MNSPITKAYICEKYHISRETLRVLLNERWFIELTAVGYLKNSRIISPKVYQKFIELYGEPEENQN